KKKTCDGGLAVSPAARARPGADASPGLAAAVLLRLCGRWASGTARDLGCRRHRERRPFMRWTLGNFYNRLLPQANRYEQENAWFRKEWWGEPGTYILNAYWLYKCANQNELGMLLLGDTKIRKDSALLFNFGLTSAGGVQEREYDC